MQTFHEIPSAWQFTSLLKKSTCEAARYSFDVLNCAPGRLLSVGLQRNAALINLGGPLAMSYFSDSQWKTFIAAQDATICILPAGARFELRWTQELNAVAFTFDDSLLTNNPGTSVFGAPQKWDITDALLAGLAKRVTAIALAPYFSERMFVESLAVACAEQITREHLHGKDERLSGRLTPAQLSQVVAFAHDCMQLDIGLVELANLVHLSPYHFGRLFKQSLGVSPYQYLLQLRIEFAKTLIVGRTGPLSDIAYQLNFSDQAHFSNAFRKATGVSPRQYLRSHASALVA